MFYVRYIGQYIDNTYGNGSGEIWLDDVECTGREKDVTECKHNGWGIHNCQHHQDVSISCSDDSDTEDSTGQGYSRTLTTFTTGAE